MEDAASQYLLPPVSNGVPSEQALIRRHWREQLGGVGVLVWEYYLDGFFADAVLFTERLPAGVEEAGADAPRRFPLGGANVIMLEAKDKLTPELIGQALVYGAIAESHGATVMSRVVCAAKGAEQVSTIARTLGLTPIVRGLQG